MRLTVALLVCSFGLTAQDQMPRKTEAGTGVTDPVVDFHRSISDHFRNSERAVMLMRDKGVPSEEIPAVLLIARRSSASPNQIMELRKSGKTFEEIGRQYKITLNGDFVKEANVIFLSDYHGRKPEDIRALIAKGLGFVEINQEYRRSGTEPATRGRKP